MLNILARQQFENSNNFSNDENDEVPFWWTQVREPQDQYCTAANTSTEGPNHKMGDLLGPPPPGLLLLGYWVLARKKAGY
jgi:hypothetical protein